MGAVRKEKEKKTFREKEIVAVLMCPNEIGGKRLEKNQSFEISTIYIYIYPCRR